MLEEILTEIFEEVGPDGVPSKKIECLSIFYPEIRAVDIESKIYAETDWQKRSYHLACLLLFLNLHAVFLFQNCIKDAVCVPPVKRQSKGKVHPITGHA